MHNMTYISSALLAENDFLAHGFGARQSVWYEARNIAPKLIFTVKQVHGNKVLIIDNTLAAEWAGGRAENTFSADAIITKETGIAIAIRTADCLPIIMAEPQHRVIAVAHAGWRGTYKQIAARTIDNLVDKFALQPENILAALGPCIGACCYEVGSEVVEKFKADFSGWRDYFVPKEKKWHLDLIGANKAQLIELGVRKENIDCINLCTACNQKLFFSYRKDPKTNMRMINLVMSKPSA